MHLKHWFAIVLVAVIAGFAGGYLSANKTPQSSVHNGVAIQATKYVLQDEKGNSVSTISLNAGEPVLKFFGSDGKERASMGVKGGEGFIEVARTDGSSTAISPNDDGPGYHLFMLKSLGKSKGVYMSMLTADDLTIHQSQLGAVLIGNLGGEVGIRVSDKSNRVLYKQPKTSSE